MDKSVATYHFLTAMSTRFEHENCHFFHSSPDACSPHPTFVVQTCPSTCELVGNLAVGGITSNVCYCDEKTGGGVKANDYYVACPHVMLIIPLYLLER
jgi:hypothetical protein